MRSRVVTTRGVPPATATRNNPLLQPSSGTTTAGLAKHVVRVLSRSRLHSLRMCGYIRPLSASPSHPVAGSRSRSRVPGLRQRPHGLARREPMRRLTASPALLCGLACLLLSTNAFGQTFQGGLRGAARDVNGVIPGVEVLLVNDATNNTRTAVTNTAGEYAYVAVE